MLANYEHRVFDNGLHIWVEKYRGLRNIPHWHLEDELIVCLSGRASIMVDGAGYALEPGICAFFGSQSIHSIASDRDCVLLVIQCEHYSSQSFPYCLKTPVFRDRYQVKERMQRIYDEYRAKPIFYSEMINAIMMQLKVDILRGEELTERRVSELISLQRYKELLTEINRHIDDFSFPEAATFMNMSEAYFSRFFKKASGMTFSQYLNVVRISRAVDLINKRPDVPAHELLAETGFNTIRNFNRVFKDVTGYSPKQLPRNYIMTVRSHAVRGDSFDPTLANSEPLSSIPPAPSAQ